MSDWSVNAIGYAGNAMCDALKILPHIEALGFDTKHFMNTAMNQLQELGVMRNAAITAVEHTISDTIDHGIHTIAHTNSGPHHGR